MEYLFILNEGKERVISASNFAEALQIIGDGMNDVIDVIAQRPTKYALDAGNSAPAETSQTQNNLAGENPLDPRQ